MFISITLYLHAVSLGNKALSNDVTQKVQTCLVAYTVQERFMSIYWFSFVLMNGNKWMSGIVGK